MAKAELLDEASSSTATRPVDVLIGISGVVDPAAMHRAMEQASRAFSGAIPNASLAVAPMDGGDANLADEGGSGVRVLSYKPAGTPAGSAPWLISGATYASLFALARATGARASVIISADLAALEQGAVAQLAAPILSGDCELAMPIYAQSRFAGLLNAGILSPLTRALYGKRVRFPLAQDFAVAPALLTLLEHPGKRVQANSESLFWPATEASIHERKMCQVYVDLHHDTVTEGVDLTTVLSQVVGPLFTDMETNAPVWQRVRASHAVPASGTPFETKPETGRIDTRPMVDSFLLATRNLQDVWSLVLPPVTQLELKRLARLQPEQFRLPDALWVRILYDFALAHRLRTLSRSHLMGALTPLYLAWVASYAAEVGGLSDAETDARLEQLALAFETNKPYLLSRWRWPDRFNP
jgi:hypothetical protein